MHKGQTLVWIDLEMTGLNPESCAILQLGMILTDTELKEVAAPIEITIWQPETVLQAMIPFVRQMHEANGLLDLVRASKTSVEEAEQVTLEMVSSHCSFQKARLCGNSISQDRRFLAKYMPALDGYLHYRQVDVSSIKELARWWYNKKYQKPAEGKHTALPDIRQSIAELKYYREEVFK